MIAGRLEQDRDRRRALTGLAGAARHQRLGDGAAERRPARYPDGLVERVMVDVVREAIAQRQRSVGALGLRDEPHQRVLAFEALEPILDLIVGDASTAAKRRGIEVQTLYAPAESRRRSVSSSASIFRWIRLRTDSGSSRASVVKSSATCQRPSC